MEFNYSESNAYSLRLKKLSRATLSLVRARACVHILDTVAERSALMEDVYPALYRHCKRRGYDFRMVDLRQGVGGPAANRHDTARLHVETVRRCQGTPGPNFVVRAQSIPSWLTGYM